MSNSSLFECLENLELRMREIYLIMERATQLEVSDRDFYDTLCRAAQVLLCSHFEGYLRDVVTKIINDINDSEILFNQINESIQKDYCRNLVHFNESDKNSKENYSKVKNLQDVLGPLHVTINAQFIGNNENINPKKQHIERMANLFSVKDIFKDLECSITSNVFSNTNNENLILLDNLKSNMYYWSRSYPYLSTKDYLEINIPEGYKTKNFWVTFIDGFLKRRHDIVHGREIENTVGHTEILGDQIKINILLIAYTILISCNSNPLNHQCVGSSLENMIEHYSSEIVNKLENDLNIVSGSEFVYTLKNSLENIKLAYILDSNIFLVTAFIQGKKYCAEKKLYDDVEIEITFEINCIEDGKITQVDNIKLANEQII